MAATAVTLNDLEGHSPIAGLFKCNSSNVCAVFYTMSTDSVLAWFLCITISDIVVGRLRFYRDSVSSSSSSIVFSSTCAIGVGLRFTPVMSSIFSQLPSKLTERNSRKTCHVLGTECDLKMHVQNLGCPWPKVYSFWAPIFFRKGWPQFLQQFVSATYLVPFNEVWLRSVCWPLCVKPGNDTKCRIYGKWVKMTVLFFLFVEQS